MEDQERRIVSFQVSLAEAESIEAAATEEGVSRSEYLRQKLLSPRPEASTTDVEAMLLHLIYITNRTHATIYTIAEIAGTLPSAKLHEIYDDAAAATARYMVDLPNRMASVRAKIAEAEEAKPTSVAAE
jgi:hypothetical protein